MLSALRESNRLTFDKSIQDQLFTSPTPGDMSQNQVFRLKRDHPGFDRVRAWLDEALRLKARVWFIAQKPDLALLDVLPVGRGADVLDRKRPLFGSECPNGSSTFSVRDSKVKSSIPTYTDSALGRSNGALSTAGKTFQVAS
jgi:hypothetical protein